MQLARGTCTTRMRHACPDFCKQPAVTDEYRVLIMVPMYKGMKMVLVPVLNELNSRSTNVDYEVGFGDIP
jgi:hypothetical protein